MTQIISKDGKVFCITEVPYEPKIVRSMKNAGYKVTVLKGE